MNIIGNWEVFVPASIFRIRCNIFNVLFSKCNQRFSDQIKEIVIKMCIQQLNTFEIDLTEPCPSHISTSCKTYFDPECPNKNNNQDYFTSFHQFFLLKAKIYQQQILYTAHFPLPDPFIKKQSLHRVEQRRHLVAARCNYNYTFYFRVPCEVLSSSSLLCSNLFMALTCGTLL